MKKGVGFYCWVYIYSRWAVRAAPSVLSFEGNLELRGGLISLWLSWLLMEA